nr:mannan-binding lectin [Streptomyces sp. DSM 41633]
MLRKLIGVAAVLASSVVAVATAPSAAASAASFCDELGGQWDGQACHTSVTSDRKAVRDIKMALPGDLVENPVI